MREIRALERDPAQPNYLTHIDALNGVDFSGIGRGLNLRSRHTAREQAKIWSALSWRKTPDGSYLLSRNNRTARITGFCDDFRRVIRLMVPISGPIGTAANGCGLSLAELGGYASRRRGSSLKPGQAGEIVDEIGHADLGSGTDHADGPHDQPEAAFLGGEDMLDP